jgi:hypothetical protein
LDGAGSAVYSETLRNFYTRGQWQDLDITFIGNRLEIYLDGESQFEDTLSTSPSGGTIEFEARRGDRFRIDDCLLTQSAAAANAGAAFAYALQEEVLGRDFRWLRSDLLEEFDDMFASRSLWVNGADAPGQFLVDAGATEHQNFLRMTHSGRPTFRMVRPDNGVSMFGNGTDARNFSDSTDLYINVVIRFPEETTGTAWLGVRSTPTLTEEDLYGYRVDLDHHNDGTVNVIIRYRDSTQDIIFLEAPVPGTQPLPQWISITAITYQDRLAFFVNGIFVLSLDNALALGGSLALGVEANTTADFDSLVVRDTSPHGG